MRDFFVYTKKEYDIVWSGKSYGRYEEIIKVYDHATKNGLKCPFVVVDDGTYEKVEREGVEHVDKLEPEESIRITMSGRCQLELKHVDDNALTIRFYEAITYGMKILTNNEKAIKNKYYNERMMKVFDNIDDVSFDYLLDNHECGYNYVGEYTTEMFLRSLENIDCFSAEVN